LHGIDVLFLLFLAINAAALFAHYVVKHLVVIIHHGFIVKVKGLRFFEDLALVTQVQMESFSSLGCF
jgi:hypothetical protein